jgi:hypothetical protein
MHGVCLSWAPVEPGNKIVPGWQNTPHKGIARTTATNVCSSQVLLL